MRGVVVASGEGGYAASKGDDEGGAQSAAVAGSGAGAPDGAANDTVKAGRGVDGGGGVQP